MRDAVNGIDHPTMAPFERGIIDSGPGATTQGRAEQRQRLTGNSDAASGDARAIEYQSVTQPTRDWIGQRQGNLPVHHQALPRLRGRGARLTAWSADRSVKSGALERSDYGASRHVKRFDPRQMQVGVSEIRQMEFVDQQPMPTDRDCAWWVGRFHVEPLPRGLRRADGQNREWQHPEIS